MELRVLVLLLDHLEKLLEGARETDLLLGFLHQAGNAGDLALAEVVEILGGVPDGCTAVDFVVVNALVVRQTVDTGARAAGREVLIPQEVLEFLIRRGDALDGVNQVRLVLLAHLLQFIERVERALGRVVDNHAAGHLDQDFDGRFVVGDAGLDAGAEGLDELVDDARNLLQTFPVVGQVLFVAENLDDRQRLEDGQDPGHVRGAELVAPVQGVNLVLL
ncbi:hypothetical protein BC936DRAFT_145942 [Jimgerdemannia flammicorona]|uniref:Uncharacterized protein n=1 Tax=Jimgerdemannia flammicorona TaxID=994334 RepID=A0A433D8V1_9FUNG|nr:hypothetical protein BC936DRAFT_145942 [Jimgerdemannia flammicorona]